MKKFLMKNKNQKGYAILFTIVIVSAVSVITAGLTNAVYKQLVLSSLAKDSQSAFYQADTAGDCALYADRVQIINNPEIFNSGGPFSCGGLILDVEPLIPAGSGYRINPTPEVQASSDPCFRIDVTKDITTVPGITYTTIHAKGYNFCDKANPRTVEREIKIDYEE
jgi:hypothetical protein